MSRWCLALCLKVKGHVTCHWHIWYYHNGSTISIVSHTTTFQNPILINGMCLHHKSINQWTHDISGRAKHTWHPPTTLRSWCERNQLANLYGHLGPTSTKNVVTLHSNPCWYVIRSDEKCYMSFNTLPLPTPLCHSFWLWHVIQKVFNLFKIQYTDISVHGPPQPLPPSNIQKNNHKSDAITLSHKMFPLTWQVIKNTGWRYELQHHQCSSCAKLKRITENPPVIL